MCVCVCMCVHRLTDASPMPIDAPELESWTFFIIKWWLLDFDFELDLNLEFLAFHGSVLCRPAGVYVHGEWSAHKYFSLFNTGRARVVQEEKEEETAPAEGRRRQATSLRTSSASPLSVSDRTAAQTNMQTATEETSRQTAAGKQYSVWPDMTNGRMVKSSYCHVM